MTARQPLPSSAQVPSRAPLWQKPPAPAAHSAGALVHEQVAVLPLAVQGLPVGHVVVCVIARQPSALSPQVMTEPLPAAQNVPAALQAAGGAGQVQAALGKLPVHGLPAVQVTDELSCVQLCASTMQVRALPPAHTVPAPVHPLGAAGQTQAALGAVPWQTCRPGQGVS